VKYCANLTYLFKDVPELERIQSAAMAGFEGVELLSPYDRPAPEISRQLLTAGLQLVLITAPPPNYTGGIRGFAAVPEAKERFRGDFERVLRMAERLKPVHIGLLAGNAEGPEAAATFIDNLKWACDRAPEQSLLIEPVNPTDVPDYYLTAFDQAAEVIVAVGAPNLGMQFDTYHALMLDGDVLGLWSDYSAQTRHIQIADAPRRSVPGAGTLDLPAFLQEVEATGYGNWIGAEYNPSGRTEASLGWMNSSA